MARRAVAGVAITPRRIFYVFIAFAYLFTLQHYFGRRLGLRTSAREWLAGRGFIQPMRAAPLTIPVAPFPPPGGGGWKYNRSAGVTVTAVPSVSPTKATAVPRTPSPADWSLGRHRLSPFELRIARKQSVRFDTRAVSIQTLRNSTPVERAFLDGRLLEYLLTALLC
jgi:hypothetical protein